MQTKRLKRNVILCFILLIIIMGLCFYIINHIKLKRQLEAEEQNRQQIINENIEKYLSDKICPRKMSTLYSNYKGENSKDDLYVQLAVLINYLPKLSKDLKEMDSDKILEYYQKNNKEIIQSLGTNDEQEFISLIKYIQNFELENATYSYCEIDNTTYKTRGDYLAFDLHVIYENLDKNLNIKIYFANRKNVTPEVKFGVVN